jgi:hypothetical protein
MYMIAFEIFTMVTGWDLGFLIWVMQTIEHHLTVAISLVWTGIAIDYQLSSPSILEQNLTIYLLPSLRGVEPSILSPCTVPINEGIHKPIFLLHFSVVDVKIGASLTGIFSHRQFVEIALLIICIATRWRRQWHIAARRSPTCTCNPVVKILVLNMSFGM